MSPAVILVLAIAAGGYAWRLHRIWADAGGAGPRRAADYLRAASFAAGLTCLALALMSPIDTLGEQRLFSVHMAQHLLIADIGPILLLLGLTRVIMRPAVRRLQGIEHALGPLAHPATALALFVGVLSAWHVPAVYELALSHAWAHGLEHQSFFITGMAFWWFVIEPVPPRRRLRGGAMVAYVASAKILLSALGILLAFSPNALYDTYEHAPRTWGLTAVEDLNVGGLIMMLEQSIVLLVCFAVLFARMLEQSERAQRQRERLKA